MAKNLSLPTYQSNVASPQVGFQLASPVGDLTSPAVGQAAQLYGQAAQSASKAVNSITDLVAGIAEVEAKELSIKNGQIKAQEGFAEIQKLEEYKAAKIYELERVPLESEDYKLKVAEINELDNQIKGYLEKGSAYNVAENVRATQLNEMYLDNVMIDAKSTIAEVYNAFQNDPLAFEAQASTMLDYLGSVPEQFREAVKYNIKTHIKNVKEKVTENQINKLKDETTARRNAKIELWTNEISQLSRDLKPVTEQVTAFKETLKQQVIDGNITAVQEQSAISSLEKDIVVNNTLGYMDKILKSNQSMPQKIASITSYANNWVDQMQPKLSEDEKQTVYSNMMTKVKSLESAYEKEYETATKVQKEFVKDVVKRVQNGLTVDAADLKRAKQFSIDAGLSSEFNIVMQAKDASDTFQSLNPNAQQAMLAKLEVEVEKKAETGESTLQDRVRLEMLQKQYKNNVSKIEKDPIGYLQSNPLVVQGQTYQPQSIDNFDNTILKDEDGNIHFNDYISGVTEELGSRYGQKRNIEGYVGSFKILSEGEANKLNRRYQAMSQEDKSKFLKELTSNVGLTEAKNIMKEMWTDKADSSIVAGQIYSTGNKKDITLADDILRGSELRRNGDVKVDTDAAERIKNKINQKLMFAIKSNVNPEQISVLKQAIEDAYLGRATNMEDFDPALVDEIFDDLTFGVSKYNGSTIFNPAPGKDDDDIENWISTIIQPGNKFLEQQSGVPDGYRDIEHFKQDFGKNVDSWTGTPKFRLESVGRGKYLIKSIDGKYILKDKKPYVLDWYVPNPVNPKGAPVAWDHPDVGAALVVDGIDKTIDTIGK